MNKRFLQLAKQFWIVFVFAVALVYLVNNSDDLYAQLRVIGWPRILGSLSFLLIAKFLLVEVSRQSVEVVANKPLFGRMLYVYALSQLAKYLPGGVWHFVGRAGYYHGQGLSARQSAQAMLVENVWLVMSAAFVGGIFFALYALAGVSLLVIPLLVISWWAALYAVTRWRIVSLSASKHSLILLLQLTIWVALGAALWVLMVEEESGFFFLCIGAFSLSWLVGYVSVFAPGGLGVREGVLVVIFATLLSPSEVAIYVSVNRIIWIVGEIILAITALLIFNTSRNSMQSA